MRFLGIPEHAVSHLGLSLEPWERERVSSGCRPAPPPIALFPVTTYSSASLSSFGDLDGQFCRWGIRDPMSPCLPQAHQHIPTSGLAMSVPPVQNAFPQVCTWQTPLSLSVLLKYYLHKVFPAPPFKIALTSLTPQLPSPKPCLLTHRITYLLSVSDMNVPSPSRAGICYFGSQS